VCVGGSYANNWCELTANHLFKQFRNCGQDGNSTITRNIALFASFQNWDDEEESFPDRGKTLEGKDRLNKNVGT
jgi:hypothetical protein